MARWVLEDDFHAEWLRTFDTAEAAVSELRRLETLAPSQLAQAIGETPCVGHCGRRDLRVIEETGKEIARAKRQQHGPPRASG